MKILCMLPIVLSIFTFSSCDSYKLPDGVDRIKVISPTTGIAYTFEENKKGNLNITITPQK